MFSIYQVLKLKFNKSTGLLEQVTRIIDEDEENNEVWSFKQNFYYYEASKGYNYNSDNRASGAYIFRPARNSTYTVTDNATISVFRGNIDYNIQYII